MLGLFRYFLCSGQGKPYNIEDFNYLRSKDNQYQRHPEVSFEKVKSSLITLEREDSYDLACRVLAAILLLGNLIPFESENEGTSLLDARLLQDGKRRCARPDLPPAAGEEGSAVKLPDLLPHSDRQ